MTLPATRMTKRSPKPWSKTNSMGTRESLQPRIVANGFCPVVSLLRQSLLAWPWMDSPATKRLLPSSNRCRASAASLGLLPQSLELLLLQQQVLADAGVELADRLQGHLMMRNRVGR